MLLRPKDLKAFIHEHRSLILGRDGCDVVMHWVEVSGTANSYGRTPITIEHSAVVRAWIDPVPKFSMAERQAERLGPVDVQNAPRLFCFLPEQDLNLNGLWFDVSGLGQYIPQAKETPESMTSRNMMIPSNVGIIKGLMCTPKK